MTDTLDLGPLAVLVGSWRGESGHDVAPEPDGVENNDYYETLVFTEVGDVSNAEEQTLGIVQYEQVVRRKTNDNLLHHQIGYWTWDAQANTVCNSFTIGRRVAVLAGGTANTEGSATVFSVEAQKGSEDWGIIESGFMRDKASTESYKLSLSVKDDVLSYDQLILVNIYGQKQFEHTDKNALTRISE